MRAGWATDIHLEFVEDVARDDFLVALRDTNADCVLLTGDTGQADSTREHLERIATALDRPVYFVLGNHDHELDRGRDRLGVPCLTRGFQRFRKGASAIVRGFQDSVELCTNWRP